MNLCGFYRALKSSEVLQLVFTTVYDDKKNWNTEKRTCRKKSNLGVNLTCFKGNLHELWQNLQEVSVVIFHLCRLDSNGRVS